MNKTLSEIQAELKVWTLYNFGEQTPDISIFGMIEELGELSHAILKEKQGIRQSDFLADKKDAIADLTIYALNYLNSIDSNYERKLPKAFLINVESLQYISYYISTLDIELNTIEVFTDSDNCNYIICLIEGFCNVNSIGFLTTVNEVWEQVKLRDWKKYPLNGISK